MNKWVKRVVIGVTILCVLGAVGAVASLVGVFWYYGQGIATLDEESLKNYRPAQVTRIYTRDGALVGELYEQRRTVVRYEQIPSHVENAFLAAEDADFYRHEGMDYMGMVRALVANVQAGKVTQGASTITQQVVKTFMLSSERSLERKVQELILSRRLEQALSKTEILELYLNEIYLGHGRYGIEEASQFYFAKSIEDINLGQAALLATLPKAPGRDSPLQNPQKAKSRQVYVLGQMVAKGFVTTEDAQRFIDAPLELAEARPSIQDGATEFVDAAINQLETHYGKESLRTLGARVYLSVELEAQRAARQAAIEGLAAIDVRNHYARGLKPAKEAVQAEVATAAGKGALAVGRHLKVLVAQPSAQATGAGFTARAGDRNVFVRVPEGSRYDDPEQTFAEQFPAGAVVAVEVVVPPGDPSNAGDGIPSDWAQAVVDAGPQAAVVALDVKTGEVRAMVGGDRHTRGDFNRAMDAKRQPGSSFKPFVYGAAILSRRYTAATLLDDSPEVYKDWKPTNYRRDRYMGPVRARVALAKSVNTIPVKLIDELGPQTVIDFARTLGIESELPANLSIALGTGEVSPFEMARAYLTFARGGERIEPRIIDRVEVRGQDDWIPEAPTERVLSEDVAFVVTSMMRSVVTEGTARKAMKLGREAVGKTGTSNESRDAWFAGYTPDLVTVTWVGFDTPKRVGKGETGGKAALPIWMKTNEVFFDEVASTFVPPASVSVRTIDASSGLLVPTGVAAEGYSGKRLDEYFIAGTEPVEEAVPAALPKGDVLLGLYDDVPTDPLPDDPSEPADSPALDDSSAPDDPSALPSLDDSSSARGAITP